MNSRGKQKKPWIESQVAVDNIFSWFMGGDTAMSIVSQLKFLFRSEILMIMSAWKAPSQYIAREGLKKKGN